MIRRLLLATTLMAVALVGTVAVLYATNGAPSLAGVSTTDPARPLVVKLHARWCPYCLMQKDEWSQIERAYAGRVNFVVLDFTNERATQRSRSEAERLNLLPFFDEYAGATGLVVVLDAGTKEVLAEVGGNQSFDEYRVAIDAALVTASAAASR